MSEILETVKEGVIRTLTFVICVPIALIAVIAAGVLHTSVAILEVVDPLDAEYEEMEETSE
jgi:hypothetical protein